MVTILHEQSETVCEAAATPGDDLWLSPHDLERATGWALKPEGFCLADMCVPVPAANRAHFIQGERVNAAALWRHLDNPIVSDTSGDVWVLGANAANRTSSLQSLEAPDFSLPDLDGNRRTLSEHRGKKVLLATWASW